MNEAQSGVEEEVTELNSLYDTIFEMRRDAEQAAAKAEQDVSAENETAKQLQAQALRRSSKTHRDEDDDSPTDEEVVT